MKIHPNKQLTPELIAYAKAIVKERGIKQADMTEEIMGDVLKEAVRKMDEAIDKFNAQYCGQESRNCFWASLYYGRPIK